jgi:hydroxymethylpyrimidine pyrophosphatase-like HAD family hydrolase
LIFRIETLYYIHTDSEKDNNKLYFSKHLKEEFYEHLLAYRQDNTKKNGDSFENWNHNGRKHDYFDCLKMSYALIEFYKNNYSGKWILNKANWLSNKKKIIVNKNTTGQDFLYSWKNKFN